MVQHQGGHESGYRVAGEAERGVKRRTLWVSSRPLSIVLSTKDAVTYIEHALHQTINIINVIYTIKQRVPVPALSMAWEASEPA
jgi:hypothetical protein